eukprot:1637498-Rhodomonas_salina.1
MCIRDSPGGAGCANGVVLEGRRGGRGALKAGGRDMCYGCIKKEGADDAEKKEEGGDDEKKDEDEKEAEPEEKED